MIDIENISIRFGGQTLFSSLNLSVRRGENVCLCGASGCGKTSLLKAILGFVPLETGIIRVDGIPLMSKTIDTIRKRVAWVPQDTILPVEWVSEMIKMPFELKTNRDTRFSKEQLMEYFSYLGLGAELYEKRTHEISGGQRQRIMLAVAAMLHKPLMMVDEPTSALDSDSCQQVIAFFQLLCTQGATILSVSHDPCYVAGCHRIVTLSSNGYGDD